MIKHLFASVTLLVVFSVPFVLAPQPPSSAKETLVRFCDRDAQGDQLSPGGRKKLSALFASLGSAGRDQLTVVRDFVVSDPVPDKDKANFYVEYIELGRVDLRNKRFYPTPAIRVRATFDVVRTSGDTEPPDWRITGQMPQPHLTANAAVRYVNELRAKAKDAESQRDLDKLLADLKRLR